MSKRAVVQILNSRHSTDGDGVKIRRTLGQHRHDLDPFLMLDEIRSDNSQDYIGGFPPHPHRGIETFTYMISGGFLHEDHLGNKAELHNGGVQWMSTGAGIIHSEQPLIKDGLLHGFQLWINLPAAQKFKKPEYAQIDGHSITQHSLRNQGVVRVLAGQWHIEERSIESPLLNLANQARILDVQLPSQGEFNISTPPSDTVLIYVFEGQLNLQNKIQIGQLVRLSDGEELHITAGEPGARFLLLSGTPLHEPIVQHGPFVMNTEEQIHQAIEDYQQGRFI